MCLKQFVPLEYCGKCDVCCRFLDEETPLAPVGLSLIPYKDHFICQNFSPAANKCKDYENRPLDCQLYPFVVMWDEDYRNVVLGVDPKCPYVSNYRLPITDYQNYLLTPIKDIDPKYIIRFQNDVEILGKLDIEVEPVLNKFLIGDKALFEKQADQTDKPISTYSFAANYVWAGLLDYYWVVIDNSFCLFCKTKDTIFMPIPPFPLTKRKTIGKCFKLMDNLNRNKNCSRIEDVCERDRRFFETLGYRLTEKGREYIYDLKAIQNLAGEKYKAKRALCNHFDKNYKFEFRKFNPGDKEACLELFKRWAKERIKAHNDEYYKALIEDSSLAHKKAMDRFEELGLSGAVVVVDKRIAAYTFGYPLSDETFVILFEVADLKIKGLAQFIFRGNCKELAMGTKLVNGMDDSGLENLKKVKLSYHPVEIEKTYCAYE